MRIALLLSSILLLASCSSDDKLVIAPLPQVSNQFELTTNWSASIGSGVGNFYSKIIPAYASGKIYIASRDGTVASFDAQTGQQAWRHKLPIDMITGGVGIGNNGLYLGTDQGDIVALTFSGSVIWTKSGNGSVISKPLAIDNKVVVNTSPGLLIALDQKTGEQIWAINNQPPKLTLRGNSSPSTDGSTIYWGTASGRLGATTLSGNVKWQQPLAVVRGGTDLARMTDFNAMPMLHNGSVYGTAYNGFTAAINPKDGEILWRSPYSSAKNFSVTDNIVVLTDPADHIIALDRTTGKMLWENVQLENRDVSSSAVIGNYIVVGDNSGYLFFINKNDGSFAAEFSTDGSGITAQPIVVNNKLIIYTRSGKLYSYQIGASSAATI